MVTRLDGAKPYPSTDDPHGSVTVQSVETKLVLIMA